MPGPGMDLIGQEEIDEVLDLLNSGYLLRYGKPGNPDFSAKVYRLEQEIAYRCQVPYAVGVNSGTSALLTGLLGLEVGPGDEVIVPGYTFVASIAAIIYAGAVPVLAEIDQSFNLDPGDVKRKITSRTKAILVVHMLGSPARMEEILGLAEEYGLKVIEDCAQAFGGHYRGQPLGSLGDVGCFSFNGYKTITAGDGGMLVMRDETLYKRCFAIHDQGHHPNRTGVEIGERSLIGLDFRLTELQAAVLLAQLKKLDGMLDHLKENKALYKALLADLPGITFRILPDPDGDIATLLVVVFDTRAEAEQVARELGSKVIAESGWHVYNHMEHILSLRTPTERHNPLQHPAYPDTGGTRLQKGMLPRTDELLSRAMNVSIGVVDPGLGAGFGVSVQDDAAAVSESAARFREAVLRVRRSGRMA